MAFKAKCDTAVDKKWKVIHLHECQLWEQVGSLCKVMLEMVNDM